MGKRKSVAIKSFDSPDIATQAQEIVLGALFGASPKKPGAVSILEEKDENQGEAMSTGKAKARKTRKSLDTPEEASSSSTLQPIPADAAVDTARSAAKQRRPTKVVLEGKEEAKRAREATKAAGKAAADLGLKVEWTFVPLEEIDLEDSAFQYRFSAGVADLRESLTASGQVEPVDLTGKKPYRIIDGFRRTRAARELGWTSVKAFIHRGISDEDASRLAFTKNVVRKNLAPLEKAQAMLLAQKRGVKKDELATAFGINERQVNRYLELNSFPVEIQKILDGFIVTMTHAKLLAEFGVKDAKNWEKRIREAKMDARALKKVLKEELGAGSKDMGRPKKYVQVSEGNLRFYPFRISKDSTESDKRQVVKLLEESLEKLKGW